MKNIGLLVAIAVPVVFLYAVVGDPWVAVSFLVLGLAVYLVSIRPSIGGPMFYAFLGFSAGFLLALLLGLTLLKDSRVGSYFLLSLPIVGLVAAVLLGRRSNYRLWFSLRP